MREKPKMVAKEGSSWKDIATRTEAIRHHGRRKEVDVETGQKDRHLSPDAPRKAGTKRVTHRKTSTKTANQIVYICRVKKSCEKAQMTTNRGSIKRGEFGDVGDPTNGKAVEDSLVTSGLRFSVESATSDLVKEDKSEDAEVSSKKNEE
jgi:hypothetical protein